MTLQKLEFLNCSQVAELLGIKTSTVYVWICKKQLPQNIYRRLGRKPLFIKSLVENWVMDGAQMCRGKH